ncbi:COR domain-containing protein [Virgisporangium aurantiacum]|uniref:non-specific serine/threonine protein kinase n=1 Tax=Virgisporangium aurantiacum TaxID=175570 RepID=A0A8J4DX79_9ACTN|nr:COR domain-containing protein [Virgisporangium aurantiacum]GIJ53649.1 hypothetical protein Vau01_011650 [Virgisporangium aurantiacum]
MVSVNDRIASAAADRSSELILSGLGLTELPEEVRSLSGLTSLDLSNNELATLPPWLADFTALERLDASGNNLQSVPESLRTLRSIRTLYLSDNRISYLPTWICDLGSLRKLDLEGNLLTILPACIGNLTELTHLYAARNSLATVPFSLAALESAHIDLERNPLAPELRAAYEESTDDLRAFLRNLERDGEFMREAKLILVGEGGVGKSSLLATLRDEEWIPDRTMTHGIEVKPLVVSVRGVSISLNGWDFGGQAVLRPTHQLFFTAPAVYLVVWNPRMGPERNFVEYWIRLIRHRAGTDVRVLVVATHAEHDQRNLHVDERSLRDQFGDMISGFHYIDSRTGLGIDELRHSVGLTAEQLPHVGRWYPRSWKQLRDALHEGGSPYLTYPAYERIAGEHGLPRVEARSMARIASALGYWIYYSEDVGLSDVVILKPDWLSTAISLVLDDPETARVHGLLQHRRLPRLWNDASRSQRYPPHLYPAFLQLMEKFDISYRIPDRSDGVGPSSLVAQLVPPQMPSMTQWTEYGRELEASKLVCEVVDSAGGEPTAPEGLMYQLIVRLHSLSLGRNDFERSIHWQGGMVLDDEYNGRALLTISGNKITVEVRAAYPQFLLHRLTEDVRRHVEKFWKGLAVRIMVPCQDECGDRTPGAGLFDVEHLVASRSHGHSAFPCSRCGTWLQIDSLLEGSEPATSRGSDLADAIDAVIGPRLAELQSAVVTQGRQTLEAVGDLEFSTQRALSQAEERYTNLILALDEEARDGPRLITVAVLEPKLLRGGFAKCKVRVTLWCEHSRLPIHVLDGGGGRGLYEIEVTRDWLVKAAPWIKATSMVIKSLLPAGFLIPEIDLSGLAKDAVDRAMESTLTSLNEVPGLQSRVDAASSSQYGRDVRADGSLLRTLHAFLRQNDPSFGGLERVRLRDRYLWVHPRFVNRYRLPPPEVPAVRGVE